MTDSDDPRSPAPIPEAATGGFDPIEPDAPRRAAMRARLLERVRAHRQAERGYVTVFAEHDEWRELSPGVRVKALGGEPGSRSFLLELKQGAALPPHRHFQDEECVVLSGTMMLENVRAAAGAYHVAPAGSRHGRVQAQTNARIYLRGAPLGNQIELARDFVSAWLPWRGRAPLTMQPDQGDWLDFAPGVQAKRLWQSGELSSMMLRLAAGACVRARHLRHAEEVLMLAGEAFFGDTLLKSGDYRCAPAGSPHSRLYSDVGADLYLRGVPPESRQDG